MESARGPINSDLAGLGKGLESSGHQTLRGHQYVNGAQTYLLFETL